MRIYQPYHAVSSNLEHRQIGMLGMNENNLLCLLNHQQMARIKSVLFYCDSYRCELPMQKSIPCSTSVTRAFTVLSSICPGRIPLFYVDFFIFFFYFSERFFVVNFDLDWNRREWRNKGGGGCGRKRERNIRDIWKIWISALLNCNAVAIITSLHFYTILII